MATSDLTPQEARKLTDQIKAALAELSPDEWDHLADKLAAAGVPWPRSSRES